MDFALCAKALPCDTASEREKTMKTSLHPYTKAVKVKQQLVDLNTNPNRLFNLSLISSGY